MSSADLRAVLRRDLAANAGYPKSVVIVVLLRVAQFVRSRPGPVAKAQYLVVGAVYKLVSEWLLGVEIPASTEVGAGLRLRHGVATVVNPHAVIGEDVMLRQGVTIGNRRSEVDCPTIGRGVEIGAGACLIGAITIGDGARIGAGALVVSDVPAGGLAYASVATVRPAPSESPAASESRT